MKLQQLFESKSYKTFKLAIKSALSKEDYQHISFGTEHEYPYERKFFDDEEVKAIILTMVGSDDPKSKGTPLFGDDAPEIYGAVKTDDGYKAIEYKQTGDWEHGWVVTDKTKEEITEDIQKRCIYRSTRMKLGRLMFKHAVRWRHFEQAVHNVFRSEKKERLEKLIRPNAYSQGSEDLQSVADELLRKAGSKERKLLVIFEKYDNKYGERWRIETAFFNKDSLIYQIKKVNTTGENNYMISPEPIDKNELRKMMTKYTQAKAKGELL